MKGIQTKSLVVLAAVALFGSACGAPRIVTTITTSDDNVKMVYNRTALMSYSTGIVQCAADDKSGELSQCKDLDICFWHAKKEKCQGNK